MVFGSMDFMMETGKEWKSLNTSENLAGCVVTRVEKGVN
jgi:hypothetical protein